jgi:hypothetical protein
VELGKNTGLRAQAQSHHSSGGTLTLSDPLDPRATRWRSQQIDWSPKLKTTLNLVRLNLTVTLGRRIPYQQQRRSALLLVRRLLTCAQDWKPLATGRVGVWAVLSQPALGSMCTVQWALRGLTTVTYLISRRHDIGPVALFQPLSVRLPVAGRSCSTKPAIFSTGESETAMAKMV